MAWYNFGQALRQLKFGGRVAREGWNGNGMWLVLVPPIHPVVVISPALEREVSEIAPWIALKTADNYLVPWTASQMDILAEDWIFIT